MKKRLNVLWLMSDQHHAGCAGYAGHPLIKTPALDRVAAMGVNFTSGFANNPICSPSRTCFVTGQYMRTHRMFGNYHVRYPEPDANLLPALFQREGYQTALVGKSHLTRRWDADSFEFIRYTDMCDADRNDPRSCHYFDYLEKQGLADFYEEGAGRPGQEYTLDGSAPAQLPYEHSIEHYTGDQTLAFLKERDPDRPFYIHMSFQRPHGPIAPAREFFDLYDPEKIELPASASDWMENKFAGKPEHLQKVLTERGDYPLATNEKRLKRCLASYYALITAMDGEIGRVLDYLEEIGELENTVICYNADHGDFAGDHGLFHKNLGIYESIQKIPYLLSWPGGPKGSTCDALVESVDLYPTLCELCGITPPGGRDGISLLPVVAGERGKEAVFCEWEMFWPAPHRTSAIRTKRWRLVYYSGHQTGELYDRAADPGEIRNLWDDPACLSVKTGLLQQLLDFTMQYERKTDYDFDLTEGGKDALTPSRLLHSGKVSWSRFLHLCNTPSPWPPMNQTAD